MSSKNPRRADLALPALRRGRALHLVDLENLVGTGSPTADEVRSAWGVYRALIQPGDQIVVACSRHAAPTVWFAVGTGVRLLARRGQDGADLALLDDVDLQHTSARYEWLVVASGDHIFAPLIRRARLTGIRTWQITGAGRSARTLATAAQVHSRLHIPSVHPAATIALAA